ncbi:carboxypeptidase-like regulatory domain-containing protein [Hanstruepera marina]|uniref:carboxypeptidase-like regulatory domain-containing protein n=1 Tax=Hanstruepera marina TaxID=2873265 RepID=UPI001CA6D654|nr:carboxypeptidase-like regulatory domain-containing protein [Hanstruepera marina]
MKLQYPYYYSLVMNLFLLTGSFVFAQEKNNTYIEINGSVTDSKTKAPLVFADLIVQGTNIATITNTEGDYLLKIPDSLKSISVVVQYLGYEDQTISIPVLLSNANIRLNPSITTLNEVTINAPKDAETLVRLMLKRKGDNSFNTGISMTGFYRETIKKRRQNASLSEAVVEIYKQPTTSNKRDAIKIVKVRKNTNYSRLDTIALKLQGGPFSNLFADIIKYPQYIFSEENLSDYTFTFDKPTQINDQLIYIVNFKQRPELKIPLFYGKLYIDSQNFALTSAIFSLNVDNKVLASELFVRKKPNKATVYPTQANYRVNYRTSNGKWYYSYSNILLTFKVNWKGRLFSSYYTLNSEMAITDWKPTNVKYEKPNNRDLILRPSTILVDEASGFNDPEFWGEYNIIEPEKSIENAIKKINKQLDKEEPQS